MATPTPTPTATTRRPRSSHPTAPEWGTSTRQRYATYEGGLVSLVAQGPGFMRPAGYAVVRVADKHTGGLPTVFVAPWSAAGLRDATRAWQAECTRLGAVEVVA